MTRQTQLDRDTRERAHRILGYLNFSSGAEDPAMLRDLNELFGQALETPTAQPAWERVLQLLQEELSVAGQSSRALADAGQARRVLEVTCQQVLPGYLAHHRDLLFHRSGESLFNAFFVGRVFEAVLQLQGRFEDPRELAEHVIGQLNDYIGHRPVAVLETRKREPYEHEWVRPLPLYIRGAGVVRGPHEEVIACAIDLLQKTDPEILAAAQFDPDLLDELAVDPRSFDFDHPVNKRPNHHFGQWDEHHLDNQGRYRRFVIHQVTLDALTSRIHEERELPREQLVVEAGSVLAGTILMAAGICGYGPGAHDSTVSLSALLPVIAAYRDRFYQELLARLPEPHRQRLAEEAVIRQQPFGAARQHLNRQLARNRAFQMVHVSLALIFSRMGYEAAAIRHADVLPVASARMLCQMECLLYAGDQAVAHNDLALASETLPRLFELLKRAVDCGAVIDPWNILGFDANYNLFQGTESTVRDHRADELALLMEQIFSFSSRVWIAAQAADQQEISDRIRGNFQAIVDWWHRFAVHEVSSVESVDACEILAATRDVAELINQWQKSGGQCGDVQFWAQHASSFTSARAYILAISSLIQREDFVTSMALLIHWLTQSQEIPLQQSSGSFQLLVGEWIARQRDLMARQPDGELYREIWRRIRKFCDYVEANAGEFWRVPEFAAGSYPENGSDTQAAGETVLPEAGHEEDLYRAAYEDMVYRESSDDGMEGSIYDPDLHSDESIQAEMQRIMDRLEFLQALADYWVESARLVNDPLGRFDESGLDSAFFHSQLQKIDDWVRQAETNCLDVQRLIRSIQNYALPQPDGSISSLADYDRQRLFKETLLDQAIGLNVDTAAAGYLLAALAERLRRRQGLPAKGTLAEGPPAADPVDKPPEQQLWIELLAGLLAGERETVQEHFQRLVPVLADKSLLYVPLSKGGNPLQIVATRVRQSLIGQLLESLPRLGLLQETRELLHVALMMERNQSVRQGAVTEFDELFRVGYTAMVDALIHAFHRQQRDTLDAGDVAATPPPNQPADGTDPGIIDCLEMLANSMLLLWLSHSQTLRLSVLEKVRESRDNREWKGMVEFIDRFGEGIFTQQFLNLSNIRAILHQGVERWLETVEEQESDEFGWQFVRQIHAGYPRKQAIRNLTWVLEAIIENFNEYRDYNCTTTQSDNGRLLYVLLDFLRLRCRYDQVSWNLKPVIWAHECLVRLGENKVASQWRRLLTERVKPEADRLVHKLQQLQDRYSIQMATVSQRINERFVHPMQVDRLTSLVAEAMQDPRGESSQRAFEMIENYAESLTQQPIGVGFELPGWITALQAEVDLLSDPFSAPNRQAGASLIEFATSDRDDLIQQIRDMPRRTWDAEAGETEASGSP
jgi:hypothetical protein